MKRKQTKVMPMLDKRTTRHQAQPDKAALVDMLKQLEAQIAAIPDKPKAVILPDAPPAKTLPEDQIQLLLKMAEVSLRTYGELVPPREVFYVTGSKECPHCGEVKPIIPDFGLKRTGPKKELKPHSWCNACRSSPDSHPGRQRNGR